MSCGNHHDTPCREVLEAAFFYIDDELSEGSVRRAITIHLEECGPCLEEISFLRRLKQKIFSSCEETAPDTLRDAIRTQITQLRLTMTEIEIHNE